MNTILLAVTGPIAAIGAWLALRNRIALSRAKHPSLSGHARLSQRLAKLLPFYEYGESQILRSGRRAGRRGGAPPDRVRAACALFVRRVAAHDPGHRRARIGPVGSPVRQRLSRSVSVLAVRAQPSEGRRPRAGVIGGPRPQSRRPHGVRSHRLLRRERVRVRLLQGMHRRRHRARPRSGSGARLVSPGGRRQRPETAGHFRHGRSVVPHVRHRSGDAGGAARAVPHRAAGPRALLRRVPRVVGRCAARRGYASRRPRHLHAEGHGRRHAACAADAQRHRVRAREPAAGAPSQQVGGGRRHAGWRRAQGTFRSGRVRRVVASAARRCARRARSR